MKCEVGRLHIMRGFVLFLLLLGFVVSPVTSQQIPVINRDLGFDFTRFPETGHGPRRDGGYTRARNPEGIVTQLAWICSVSRAVMDVRVNMPPGIGYDHPVRAFWEVKRVGTDGKEAEPDDPDLFGNGLLLAPRLSYGMRLELDAAERFTRQVVDATTVAMWFFGYDSDERDGPHVFGVRGLRDVLNDMPCAPRIEER